MVHCELVFVVRVKFLVLHVRFLEDVVAFVIVGIRAASSALLTGSFLLQYRPLKKENQQRVKLEQTFERVIRLVSCTNEKRFVAEHWTVQSGSHAHVSPIAD